jgi:Protein of unknown function (DUF3311)
MPTPPASTRTRPTGRAAAVAGVLLLVPCIGLAVVPMYSSETPYLWGFPFFYWYQLLWVFLGPAFTWTAYVVLTRSRGRQ